jgi:Ca2+-binding RTX toxin-like protein
MRLPLTAVLVLVGLLAAAPAQAGTVASDGRTITFTAAPGEANEVTVIPSPTQPGFVVVGDSVAPAIAPGSDCQRKSASSTQVSCRVTGTVTLVASLGDGRDRFNNAVHAPSIVDAGEGDDLLFGGDGDDTLIGGPGDDDFYPDWEIDPITNPTDTVNGRDVIVGGDGRDSVGYGEHPAPLAVSLNDVADDGVAGEGDNVHADVEEVSGSLRGPNTLIGAAAADRLSGGPTADVLVGGEGDDSLFGGGGDDRLDGDGGRDTLVGGDGNDQIDGGADEDSVAGGAGDDAVSSRDGVYEPQIDCQEGTDTLRADPAFLLPDPPFIAIESADAACERVDLPVVSPVALAAELPRGGKRIAVSLLCPGSACSGRVTMRTAKRVRVGGSRRTVTLGTTNYRLGQTSSALVPLRSGRTARRVTRRGLRVKVTLTALPGRQSTSATLALKGARR